MLSGRPGPFFKWNASLWAEGIITSPVRIRVTVLLLVQCWSLHIFSRAEFSLSPAAPHDLKASAFLQFAKKKTSMEIVIPPRWSTQLIHAFIHTDWSKLQALKGKGDPTLIRRREAARRGAGRSTLAGLHAPNTKAGLAPAEPSLSSSLPETQERKQFQRRKKPWWGLRMHKDAVFSPIHYDKVEVREMEWRDVMFFCCSYATKKQLCQLRLRRVIEPDEKQKTPSPTLVCLVYFDVYFCHETMFPLD